MRSIRFSVWDPVALLSLAAGAAATWSVYDRLPDPLPTHFDIHGTPNGWMPRAQGAWLILGIGLVLWLVMRFAVLVLPQKDRQNLRGAAVPIVATMTTGFLVATHIAVLYIAVTPGANVTQIIFLMMSLFFIGLGLMMPRLKRNPILGVRTKWTLTSDENWARTHRVAGYSMVGGGILGGLGALVGGLPGTMLALSCFVASGIVPAVWSLMYARRQDAG